MGIVFLFINSPPEVFQIWPDHQGPSVVGGVATEAAKVGGFLGQSN